MSNAPDAIQRARVVIHPLSRAIDRETRQERVRARVDAHAPDMATLASSSRGEMRHIRADRRLTFTLATVGGHGASRRRRASSGVRRRGARDRTRGGV